jgi:hypothetical protein
MKRMRKEVTLMFLGMLLVGFMFASAEWTSVGTEFVGVDEGENYYGEDVISYEEGYGNYWFWVGLIVLVLIVGIVYFRKVNKGKVSRKGKVKRK